MAAPGGRSRRQSRPLLIGLHPRALRTISRCPQGRTLGLNGEADGAQLLTPAVRDVGRPPGGYPLPVDAEVLDAG